VHFPHDPAVGKNGDLWFTEQMANKIGRFDPASQNFKEYPLSGRNTGPTAGYIWHAAAG
jgi:streptogramin lyase